MSDKHWYIIQAYSNFERKVADSIREQAKQRHLDHLFEEVMVPTEKVVEVRRGQKVDAERKFFPGYVLVKMDLTDEAYHLIKNTPKVTAIRTTQSATMKNAAATNTITNTMSVVMKVSRLLGQVTFCASTRTSCKNLNGLIFAIRPTCRRLGRAAATHCAF